MAVSAIGNPASFEQTLLDVGADIIESLHFPDHHDYTVEEMQDVMEQALTLQAEAVVITEKDAVKVPVEIVRQDYPIPIYVISVEVTFQNGSEEFRRMLADEIGKKTGRITG